MSATEEKLQRALEECASFRAESNRLRSILEAHHLLTVAAGPPALAQDAGGVHNDSAPDDKVNLFRSLFRGREDVFALRWEKGGKSGYAPAAEMDWAAIRSAPAERGKEVERILGACDGQDRVAFATLLLTGLREQELRYLT